MQRAFYGGYKKTWAKSPNNNFSKWNQSPFWPCDFMRKCLCIAEYEWV